MERYLTRGTHTGEFMGAPPTGKQFAAETMVIYRLANTEWARQTSVDGQGVVDKPWVQQNLARIYAKVQVLRLMNWK